MQRARRRVRESIFDHERRRAIPWCAHRAHLQVGDPLRGHPLHNRQNNCGQNVALWPKPQTSLSAPGRWLHSAADRTSRYVTDTHPRGRRAGAAAAPPAAPARRRRPPPAAPAARPARGCEPTPRRPRLPSAAGACCSSRCRQGAATGRVRGGRSQPGTGGHVNTRATAARRRRRRPTTLFAAMLSASTRWPSRTRPATGQDQHGLRQEHICFDTLNEEIQGDNRKDGSSSRR